MLPVLHRHAILNLLIRIPTISCKSIFRHIFFSFTVSIFLFFLSLSLSDIPEVDIKSSPQATYFNDGMKYDNAQKNNLRINRVNFARLYD